MTAPKRIQLRRTKGWRKPEGAIVVARPTRFGNPFVVGSQCSLSGFDADGMSFDGVSVTMTRSMAVEAYRDLMIGRLDTYGSEHPDDLVYVQIWRDALDSLRGRDLACWCPLDQPCHADVLLELANAKETP